MINRTGFFIHWQILKQNQEWEQWKFSSIFDFNKWNVTFCLYVFFCIFYFLCLLNDVMDVSAYKDQIPKFRPTTERKNISNSIPMKISGHGLILSRREYFKNSCMSSYVLVHTLNLPARLPRAKKELKLKVLLPNTITILEPWIMKFW